MKSFLSSLRKLDFPVEMLRDRITATKQFQLFTTLLLSGAIIGSSIGLIAAPATAAPARKDWCSTIWSVDNAGTTSNGTTRIDPITGATTTTSPATGITMPPFFPGTGSVAGLGIHAESGTLYAFDRTGTTGTLYKYKLGTDTTWQPVAVSGLAGLSAIPSKNLNKVTVDGNTLYIAESAGLDVYSIPLNSSGVVIGNATLTAYTFSGDPIGTPPHTTASFLHNLGGTDTTPTDPIGSAIMNGGDIAIDEYGDVYNVTYNVVLTAWNLIGITWTPTTVTNKAYFYKQSGTTWVYQGETPATSAFAGAAFYKGELYVKSTTQLRKVPLVRSGSGYTGWNSTLSNVGAASTGYSSADLAACGTPNITMAKTQQIYADAALTTLVADQTKVKTGQYIKYTITAQNTGTSWARSTTVTDSLPTGTTYVANSASLNGTSLGFTTYPTSGFVINAPGSVAGTVPYSTGVAGSDTATMSFAVQVTATNGAVQNQATVAYVDNSGLPSEPSVCTSPFLNCSVTPSVTATAVDFGDAPDGSAGTATGNYRTTESDNGASHVITAGIKLGTTAPDADNGLQQNAAANTDGADEDAFTSLPNVPTTGTYSLTNVPVTNTTGSAATLHAWVDFNNNGSFEAGEYASATVANNATTANLSWTVPAGTVAGSTYARFRLTTQALTDNSTTTTADERSFGAASNGEVEDYQVSIVAPLITPFKDRINSCGLITFDSNSEGFRAATITFSGTNYNAFTIPPQSAPYPTSLPRFNWQSSGNPGGSIFTNDLDGQWTIFTTPDLGTDTNFSFLNSKSLTFDYKNDTGIGGAYDFWVALVGKNGNKVFYSFKTQLTGASTTAFSKVVVPMDANKWFTTFQTPTSAAPTSTVFAGILSNLDRIDIGAEGRDGPDLTEIDNMGMACDRGDAPNTYSTLAAANGPSHQIISALKLGAKIDAENDGQPNATATGDNQDLSASNQIGVVNDEDGITAFPALTVGGTSYSIPAANITAVNTTGGAATLHAWIDFNKNGTFEATEYTSTTINTSGAATGPLSWTTGFTVGSSGSTFARFRLTTDTSITASTPGSSATNGEVEDYRVSILSKANVLLVKRITAINGIRTGLTSFVDDVTATPQASNDNNCNWLGATGSAGACTNTYTVGATSAPKVKPDDEIEYTIYYLNAGGNKAKQARVCDQLDANLTFQDDTPTTAPLDIQLVPGSGSIQSLTNAPSDDKGELTTAALAGASCNLAANTGTNLSNNVVVVDVASPTDPANPLMGSTGAGTPTTSYGYVRFKATVK